MSIATLLQSLTSNSAGRSSRKPINARTAAVRAFLEPLEDRRMLSFTPAVDYPVGGSPLAIVAADFNSDGRLDLATASSSSNVSVMLGNADGTFQAAQTSATGTNPLSLAVGDFNADGKLDLVTANAGDVSVLLGNGNGTFQAPASINNGISPSCVAVGDFNNDGKLDLGMTSNVYYGASYGGWYIGQANVLLGTGAGSFAAPIVTSLGWGNYDSEAFADFNGDGKLDFATHNALDGTVKLLLGTGTGALGAANNFYADYYSSSTSTTARDVNADGNVDLMVAGSVLLGTGTGSFAAAQSYNAGASPKSLAVADFNGDGKIDLVTANAGGTVSVLLGDGTGAFRPPVIAAVGAGASGVAAGDFNGDGRADAASANSGANNISVLLNDGIWPALSAPSFTITDPPSITEGNTGSTAVSFTVNLSAAYSQTVTVQYATANGSATAGSDYEATTGTLTFAPGQTSKTIAVLVKGDRIGEYYESFVVNLSGAANAFITDSQGVGTIIDDEPDVGFMDYYFSSPEGNVGTTPFTFTVTLSAAYDAPVTVNYATADLTPDDEYWSGPGAAAGSDYQATSGTLTFAPGETSRTITVLVNGDRIVEASGNESFFVNLSNSNGPRLFASQAIGIIIDDEPYIYVDYTSIAEGNTGTKNMDFTVGLSAAYDAPVTVNYATSDNTAVAGNDYVATSGTLTFAPGQTSLILPVTVKGDLLAESNEYFSMNLSDATNGWVGNGLAWGFIVDDDTPPAISVSDASLAEGNSGTTLMTFTVSLSQPSGSDVWVNYTTANSTAKTSDNDYSARSGTVYFAPGETSKTIQITIKGDTRKEKNETFFMNLSGAINGSILDSQGVGTILNDDGATHGGPKFAVASSLAAAVDAVMEDYELSGLKKRGR
jgi:hypothetical protein